MAFFAAIFALFIPIITGILVIVALVFGARTLRRRKKKDEIVFDS